MADKAPIKPISPTTKKTSITSKYNTNSDASGKLIFYTTGENNILEDWKKNFPKGVKDTDALKKTLVQKME